MEFIRSITDSIKGFVNSVATKVGNIVYAFNKTLQDKVYGTRFFQRNLVRYHQLTMPGYRHLPLAEVIHYASKGFGQGRVWQRAKGLAYSLLMALPPLLIFLFTLVAFLPLQGVQDELLMQVNNFFPEEFSKNISEIINDVMGKKHGSWMSIGFFVSVFLATNGMYGCLMSMNYGNETVERQGLVMRYAVCLMLVFLLFILLVAAMSLLVGYKHIMGYLLDQQWIAESKITMFMFSLGRWVILVALTLLVLILIYRFAMPRKQRKQMRFFSIGSVIATLLFFALTWGFQIYLDNFNNFNILYGSIGTILIMMLWLFANCYVMLLGYEINVSVIRSSQEADGWRKLRRERRDAIRRRRRKALRLPIEEKKEEVKEKPEERPEYVTLNMEMTLRKDSNGNWTTVETTVRK